MSAELHTLPKELFPRLDESANGWWWFLLRAGRWVAIEVNFDSDSGADTPLPCLLLNLPTGSQTCRYEINPAEWGGRITPPTLTPPTE